MISISVNFDSNKFNKFIQNIENDATFTLLEAKAMALAEDAIDSMKQTINSSRKRPDLGTHKLENALGEPEEVLNNPGKELIIGIGNKDKLKSEAPYWEVLDVGGYVPPWNRGHFGAGEPPQTGADGQTWTHDSNGRYLLQPKKAIDGIDYIGKALRDLDRDFKKMVAEVAKDYAKNIK